MTEGNSWPFWKKYWRTSVYLPSEEPFWRIEKSVLSPLVKTKIYQNEAFLWGIRKAC